MSENWLTELENRDGMPARLGTDESRKSNLAVVISLLVSLCFAAGSSAQEPIIDMHIHAASADMNGPPPMGFCAPYLAYLPPYDSRQSVQSYWFSFFKSPPCENPIWSPDDDNSLLAQVARVLETRNVIAVAGGSVERVDAWHKKMPERVIKAKSFVSGDGLIPVDEYRALFELHNYRVMAEVAPQYLGISPLDERLAPYWALAEELEVPIGYHMVDGIPGINQTFAPKHRALIGNPELLEEILIRHPRLRLFVMHYGSPWVDEMIALMNVFPQVYVDLGGIQWVYPRPYFYKQLQEFMEAGFGKRIMFGSDQMNWPGLIEFSIEVIEEAPFLSAEQKRDIFYNNAARFLQLSDEVIERHHTAGNP